MRVVFLIGTTVAPTACDLWGGEPETVRLTPSDDAPAASTAPDPAPTEAPVPGDLPIDRASPPGGRSALGEIADRIPPAPLPALDLTRRRVSQQMPTEGHDPDTMSQTVQCDPSFGSPLGGSVWWAFGDQDCLAGQSISFLQLLHNGSDDMGCHLRWVGQVQEPRPDPFAGIGIDVPSGTLAGATALRLALRGDGERYILQTVTQAMLDALDDLERSNEESDRCAGEAYDFPRHEVRCGDGTTAWHEHTVPLSAFAQEGFGHEVALDPADIVQFQMVTTGATPRDIQCGLKVLGVDRGTPPAQ